MNTAPLFKSRQLTEYREWSNGRKGCLFYVHHPKHVPLSNDAIIVIDTLCRKGDKLGDYDQLHESEWKSIKMNDCVLIGFDAFVANRMLLEPDGKLDVFKEWKVYVDELENDSRHELYHVFDMECRFWKHIKKEYLDLLFPKEIQPFFPRTAFPVIMDWLKQEDTQFYHIAPKIMLPDPEQNVKTYLVQYNIVTNKLYEAHEKWALSGFRAFLIHFIFANHIVGECDKAIKRKEFDIAADIVYNKIWNVDGRTEALLNYKDVIDIYYHDININHVYEAYIKMMTPKIELRIRNRSIYYDRKDEKEKRCEILANLLEKEWPKSRAVNPFYPFMKITHQQMLDFTIGNFFEYLLINLEGSDYFEQWSKKLRQQNDDGQTHHYKKTKQINLGMNQAVSIGADNEIFQYIRYIITDQNERLEIHKQVCNIVRFKKMQLVCEALGELMAHDKIMKTIDQRAMLAELRRLGLPDDNTPGFSDDNFFSAYQKMKNRLPKK